MYRSLKSRVGGKGLFSITTLRMGTFAYRLIVCRAQANALVHPMSLLHAAIARYCVSLIYLAQGVRSGLQRYEFQDCGNVKTIFGNCIYSQRRIARPDFLIMCQRTSPGAEAQARTGLLLGYHSALPFANISFLIHQKLNSYPHFTARRSNNPTKPALAISFFRASRRVDMLPLPYPVSCAPAHAHTLLGETS